VRRSDAGSPRPGGGRERRLLEDKRFACVACPVSATPKCAFPTTRAVRWRLVPLHGR